MPLAIPLPIASAVGAAGVALRRVFTRASVPAGLPECCPPPPPVPGFWSGLRAAAALRRLLRDDPARYDTPWIALLGEQGAGKSSLAASISAQWRTHDPRLPRPEPGAPAQWQMFEMGALVDIDGALPAQAAGPWRKLLRELQDLRPERPLDGILLALSARTLAGPSTGLQASAANVRRQLDSVQQRLGFTLPVYLVVTQADAVQGFTPFWDALPGVARSQMIGWSCPALPDGGTPAEWSAQAFAEAGQRLRALQVTAASGTGPILDADDFFLFPRHLGVLRGALAAWMEVVLQPSCLPGGFALRGIYFTGSVAAAGAMAPGVRTDVSFVDDLAIRKVLAERRLARPGRRRIWSRERRLRALQATLAAAILGMAALFVGSSLSLAGQAGRLPPALDAMRRNAALPHSDPCLPKARAYELLALVERVQPSFHYRPWSWLDHHARERSATQVAQAALAGSLMPAIQCRLAAKAGDLLKQPEAGLAEQTPAQASDAGRLGLFGWIDQLTELELNAGRMRAIANNVAPDDPVAAAQAFLGLLEYAYGSAPPRPAQQAGAAPLLWLEAQLAKAGLPTAWLTAQPSPARVERDGALVQAMGQLHYPAPATVDNVRHAQFQKRLRGLSTDLGRQLQRNVDSGAATLGELARLARPDSRPQPGTLPDAGRKASEWLAWVRTSWLPSTDERNPCRDVADGLLQRQATLGAYHYELPAAGFSAGRCYADAMRSLRNQEVPGFGPVTSPGDDPAHPVLNPGLAREPAGLAALAKLEFMQAAPAPRSYCVIDAGWDGALLGRASAYAREYQAFADKLHLDGSAADPLFGRAARRQLQLAMDAAVAAAQQPENAAPSSLDGPDARMSARSARFAAATAPLATVTALYRQLGFTASATSLDSCVRDQASAALLQVGDLAQQSQVYAPPRAGDGALLFAMGDAAATDQFLANQLGRVKVLASYAEPYARYLQDSRPLADQQKSPSQLDPYWSNTIGELYRYQAATDSNGQAGKLHALFSRVLPTLDTGNCRKAAIGVVTDGGNDLFSDHRRTVSELAASRCGSLGDAQLLADYLAFADLYDSALAGRFPFGPVTAPDLPLDQARRFFAANGAQLASLRSRADQRKEPRWHARRAFLDQLDDARSLLIDQLAGPAPLKLALAFNARPGSSAGADQIANWTFTSADRSTGWPNRSPTTVAWRAGQAIALDLQWADRSAWHPLADPGQYDLTIEGATAGFAWGGDWALLRMLAQHRPREDGTDGAIELRVPVGAAPDGRQSAFAYLYLGVAPSSADPKTKADAPLTVPARFPHFAPR